MSVNNQLAIQNGSTSYLDIDDYILIKSRQTELAEVETEDDDTVAMKFWGPHFTVKMGPPP